jgi:hypothetical protein
MSVVDTVKGALPTVKLPESKVPFAVLGAGDLAFQRAKTELPSIPASVLARIEDARRSLPGKAQAQVEAQVEVVKGLPALVAKAAGERRQAFHDQLETWVARGEMVVAARSNRPVTTPISKPATKPVAKKVPGKKSV